MSFGRRVGVALAVAGLAAAGTGFFAASSYATAPTDCSGVFHGSPPGSLAITTDPAAGSVVAPGDAIVVQATWDSADWSSLNKVDTCVTIDGEVNAGLGDLEAPAANDGLYSFTVHVPADTAGGIDVCVRVGVHGQPAESNVSTQKSNIVCFTVETPTTTTTEAPSTTTTTEAPSTTTTTEAPSTTTTTEAPSTTTTLAAEPTTTTTTTGSTGTTVTTGPGSTTSTTSPTVVLGNTTTSTTTAAAPSTTPPGTQVLGETETLPRTGADVWALGLPALALVVAGLGLMGATRKDRRRHQV